MLDRVIKQLGLKVDATSEVEDSHSSTVYKCQLITGKTVFLKIPYTKLKFQRELEAYEVLKGKVAIPDLLGYWSGDVDCSGAFVLSELKGEPLTKKSSSTVALQVGVLHAKMHQLQPPAHRIFNGIKNEYPTWSAFIERQFYSFAEDVKLILDERKYKQAINKYEEMKSNLPPSDGPSFVHMDFRPANIIVDGDHVTGVIDFESVRFGSAEVDFTKLYRDYLSFDAIFYEAYKDGYNSVRPLIDLEAVLPFYQFTDAFNAIGWCKRRGIEKNRRFLEENRERLDEILG